MDDLTRQLIEQAGWVYLDSIWASLSEYEKSFVIKEFTGKRSFNYYLKRLEAIGFKGMARVLDAACGMGQWALALSSLNEFVEGVDINKERLQVSKSLADSMGRKNCTFQYGFLESLPFESESFDGVFCYGSFMFTHMPTTLSEFFRVLKPGGKVYLNANSIGWYAHLLIDRGFKKRDFSMVRTVLNIAARTIAGEKKNRVVSRKWLKNQMESSGLKIVATGLEGEISVDDTIKPEPAYNHYFYGFPSIVEVLARKRCT